MCFLENIFSWQIDKIHGYILFHLMILIITILVTILFVKEFKNHNEQQVKKTVFIFGIFFFCLELYKQLFYNVFEDVSSYQWNIFPFQLCSTPIYFCLITPILK